MRKQELLKRIEALEEKVRLLEIALQLHEMTKHPAPVMPYVPWGPSWPDHWVPPQTWPTYPLWDPVWTVTTGNIENGTAQPETITTDIITSYSAGTRGSCTTVQ